MVPTATQIILDELRDFRKEARERDEKQDERIAAAHTHASNAHNRIDKHESRVWGIIAGSGLGGGGIAAFIIKLLS